MSETEETCPMCGATLLKIYEGTIELLGDEVFNYETERLIGKRCHVCDFYICYPIQRDKHE